MENRHIRRNMRHCHSLFPANQGHQGSRIHDARTQSLDKRPHDGHNTLLSGRIHTPHAIAPRAACQCVESNSHDGHFRSRHGICRQRPRQFHRSAAVGSFSLHRLCRQWQWRSTHISHGGTQRPVGHIRVVSDRSRSDHGRISGHIAKGTKSLSDRNRTGITGGRR